MFTSSPSELPEGAQELPAAIASEGVTLQGAWIFPIETAALRVPCVILAGGTLSHTRDGAMEGFGPAGMQRDALKRLALHLAAAGYATLRWDKRGHGQTPPGPQPVTNELEAADVAAAIELARAHPRVSAVIVLGESAGGYHACLAAAQGTAADGYIFLGCLASPSEELYRYNYGRLRQWAERSEANLRWCEKHCLIALALGYNYEQMFRAARRGEKSYLVRYKDKSFSWSLARIRTEIEKPPAELFRRIKQPALILQGSMDMNVPPGDAELIEHLLKQAGNQDMTKVIIPGVDHNFQYAAETDEQRWKDRYGLASLYRLYTPRLYEQIVLWLRSRFPSPLSPRSGLELRRPGIIAWNGIQIVDDVTDDQVNPGVDTLEGRIGPLLRGEGCQVHFIEMPPGLFLAEHPHATESLVYTVRGKWVLCSGGHRHLMRPGSLFWFQKDEPTGWEVPFDQPAYVLIFKGSRSEWTNEQFWEYLQGLAQRLQQSQERGEIFRFDQLPPHHPARIFARQINPAWEANLPRSPLNASKPSSC